MLVLLFVILYFRFYERSFWFNKEENLSRLTTILIKFSISVEYFLEV